MPVIESTGILAGVLTTVFAAALALVTPEVVSDPGTVVITSEVLEILAHKTLRLYCLIGAVMGGLICIAITGGGTVREMAWKWLTGVCSGIVFTPLIIRWAGIHPGIDYIVGASAIVAILAWTSLHKLVPIVDRWLLRRVRKLVGDNSDPSPSPRT